MSFPTFNFENIRKEPIGTIYLVDDDADVRDSLRRLLETEGYRVEAYDSGEAFLAKYDPNAIAVLLLDQRMPGMPGTEVQDHLIARKASIPVVFLTGHGDVPMAVSALKKGAADFLQKPVEVKLLLPLISRLLSEAREQRVKNERQAFNEAML